MGTTEHSPPTNNAHSRTRTCTHVKLSLLHPNGDTPSALLVTAALVPRYPPATPPFIHADSCRALFSVCTSSPSHEDSSGPIQPVPDVEIHFPAFVSTLSVFQDPQVCWLLSSSAP